MRTLFALVLVLAFAQETHYPADHFCMAGPPDTKTQPKGHECKCALVCEIGPDGPIRIEQKTCAMYCVKNRCLCHEDQGCDPKGM